MHLSSKKRLGQQALVNAERRRSRALTELLFNARHGERQGNAPEAKALELDEILQVVKTLDRTVIYFALLERDIRTWVIQRGGNDRNLKFGDLPMPDLRSLIGKATKLLYPRGVVKCEDRSLSFLYPDESKQTTGKRKAELLSVINPAEILVAQQSLQCDPAPGSASMECKQAAKTWPTESKKSEDKEESQLNSVLKDLFQILLSPVRQFVKGSQVVVVPDGPLALVPFAALIDGDGLYVAETLQVRLVPSLATAKMVMERPEEPEVQTSPLIVGDPDVDQVRRGIVKIPVKRLPFAKAEAEMVGELLNVEPFTGERATKENFLEHIESANLIHIASHGDMERRSILLAPSPGNAGRNLEDVLLTITDLEHKRLRAKLVVLSCCHSGRGKVRAEGVIGIGRAFLGAGARAVLVTLWAVDDEATKYFMRKFYQHLICGKRANVALHAAMKAMRGMEKFRHPRHWAPFVLIGEDVAPFETGVSIMTYPYFPEGAAQREISKGSESVEESSETPGFATKGVSEGESQPSASCDPSKVSDLWSMIQREAAALKRYKECLRVLVYGPTQKPTVTVYSFYRDGVPDFLKQEGEERFRQLNVTLQWVDLSKDAGDVPYVRYPSGFQTLPASKASEIGKVIKKNLALLSRHSNITLVFPSFKVTNFVQTDTPCVTVYVLGKGCIPLGECPIPSIMEGFQVDVLEGFWFDCGQPVPKTWKAAEPLKLGVSIGLKGSVTAGTLGAFVETKEEPKEAFILSCNHVLESTEKETPDDDKPSYQSSVQEEDGIPVIQQLKCTYEEKKRVVQPSLSDDISTLVDMLDDYIEAAKQVPVVVEKPERKVIFNQAFREELYNEFKTVKQMREELKTCTESKERTHKRLERMEDDFEDCYWNSPRTVARYVTGVADNVSPADTEDSYFIDAGLAKLEKKEEDILEEVQLAVSTIESKECKLSGVSELKHIEEGEAVYKCGRSTLLTRGNLYSRSVYLVDSPNNIRYGCGKAGKSTFHVLPPNCICEECAEAEDDSKYQAGVSMSLREEEECQKCKKLRKCWVFYNLQHYYCDDCAMKSNITIARPSEGSIKAVCNLCRKIKLCQKRKLEVKYLCMKHCGDKQTHDPKLIELRECEICHQEKHCLLCYEDHSPISSSTSQEFERVTWRHNCLLVKQHPFGSEFARSGDSGAVIFDDEGKAVGLLFGCLYSPYLRHVLACPLEVVLSELGNKLGRTLQLKTS